MVSADFISILDKYYVVVDTTPHLTALIYKKHHISYQTLDKISDKCAMDLYANKHIKFGDVVAISMNNHPNFIVILLAVMKCGAAFLLIDPVTPWDRVVSICNNSDCVLFITDQGILKDVINNVCFIDDWSFNNNFFERHLCLAKKIQGFDCAYLIYTSGSSGNPKGIAISHGAIANYCQMVDRNYDVASSSHFALCTSIGFDLTLTSILFPLCYGHTLHIFDNETNVHTLLEQVLGDKLLTHLKLTPSHLKIIKELTSSYHNNTSLKIILVGGEQLHFQLAKEIWDKFNRQIKLINEYGPSETTIGVSYAIFRDASEQRVAVSIGDSIQNVKFKCLDDKLGDIEPASLNGGELFISGSCVGIGYWGNSRLTAEKFLPDPESISLRMYRTGDLCKYGYLEGWVYVGRLDRQLKLNGYRIETDEIEFYLKKHPNIIDVVVTIYDKVTGKHFDLVGSNPLLVAFVKISNNSIPLDLKILMDGYLSKFLPRYMLPMLYICIDHVPLTNSGKINYQALPKPLNQNDSDIVAADKLYDDLQVKIATIWAKVLNINISVIGLDTNYFSLGGDSITAITIVNQCKDIGIAFSVNELFLYPTIRALAEHIVKTVVYNSHEVFKRNDNCKELVLSPIQNWFLSNFKNINHYNQGVIFCSKKAIKDSEIKEALYSLIKRHTALQVMFYQSGFENYKPIIKPGEQVLKFQSQNLEGDLDDGMLQKAIKSIYSKLDIFAGPIIFAQVFVCPNKVHLILVAHHLLVDAFSWRIIIEELTHYLNGNTRLLTKLNYDYYGWVLGYYNNAINDSSGLFRQAVKFWQEQETAWLSSYSSSNDNRFFPLARRKKSSYTLLNKELEKLENFAQTNLHGRVEAILLLFFTQTLAIVTEMQNVWVQVESHGREVFGDATNLAQLIGWFTALNPLLLKIENTEIVALLRQYQDLLHRVPNIPFGYLGYKYFLCHVDERSVASNANYIRPKILFNYLGKMGVVKNDIFDVQPILENTYLEIGTTPYFLEANIYEQNSKLEIAISYDLEIITEEKANVIINMFAKSLENFINICQDLVIGLLPSDCVNNNLSLAELDYLLKAVSPIQQRAISAIYTLTPMQRDLLFYERFLSNNVAYHQTLILSLKGYLDNALVEKAIALLVEEYEALRTIFFYDDLWQPRQIILKNIFLDYQYQDLSGQESKETTNFLGFTTFDLKKGPLFKVKLIKIADNCYKLIWYFHHLIMDGWSVVNAFKRLLYILEKLYKNQVIDSKQVLLNLEYYNWLDQYDKKTVMDYWRSFLDDKNTTACLPKQVNGDTDAQHKFITSLFKISEKMTNDLNNLCKSFEVTLSTILHGIWGILLYNYCLEKEIFFGTVVSGRGNGIAKIHEMVGLFINTVPIKIVFNHKTNLKTYFSDIQNQLRLHEANAVISFGEIQALVKQKDKLINSLLVVENYPLANAAKEIFYECDLPIELETIQLIEQNHYDFSITFIPSKEIDVEIQFDDKIYNKSFIEQIQTHFLNIIDQIINNASSNLGQINIIKDCEKFLLKKYFLGQSTSYKPATIVELFIKQTEINIHRIAVVQQDKCFSYDYLNKQSTKLARHLQDLGISFRSVVGILLGKHVDKVIAWLAVLKVGACYVPLDINTSAERINYIIKDAGISVILTHAKISNSTNFENSKIVSLDLILNSLIPNYSNQDSLFRCLPPELPAYIVYTSGSTGVPKGVVVAHQALYNHFVWMRDEFQLSAFDRMLQILSFNVDTAITELYILLVGGLLVFLDDAKQIDLVNISLASKKHKATIAQMVPSILKTIVANQDQLANSIRHILCGAEALEKETLRAWYMQGNTASISNVYGITEACIDSTVYHCSKNDVHDFIPIGRPICNVRTYILSDNFVQVPIGVKGELYLAGIGLAQGYLNKPRLTAEKFLPDIYGSGGRMYKSGDVVSFCQDGNIKYYGRSDRQVKIRGIRIELMELESILSSHPQIKDSVAKVFVNDNSQQILCVYYVASMVLRQDDIKNWLLKYYPPSLLPNYFIALDKIPLMLNGKVDYHSLMLPTLINNTIDNCLSDLEAAIRNIWSKFLSVGVANIPLEVNFFDLGGNSISLMEVHSEIHKNISSQITIEHLFQFPTIRTLSKCISGFGDLDYLSEEKADILCRKLDRTKRRANMRKLKHKRSIND